ncbi:hypothetical protein LFYK43_09200 [Ligilactobacillus salitolerans]|uniref:Uncharacterized protein n=1 Tax=Ligilactobacillus salitolerans TaxID=1808352 RepID=A0A401ISG4_9LACO|nr:hypothetical protein [Ligilactobacillus salitolerans]GBG94461.1 hypothetical protein LFYK43_09200 [Ligilactobacillus salitolerans]
MVVSYLEQVLTNIVALSGKRKVVYHDDLAISTRLYGYPDGTEISRRDLERFAQLAMAYQTELEEVPDLKSLIKRDNVTLRFEKNFDPEDQTLLYQVILGNSVGFLTYRPEAKQQNVQYGVLYFDGHSDQARDEENWQEFHASVLELLENLQDNFYDPQVTFYDRE